MEATSSQPLVTNGAVTPGSFLDVESEENTKKTTDLVDDGAGKTQRSYMEMENGFSPSVGVDGGTDTTKGSFMESIDWQGDGLPTVETVGPDGSDTEKSGTHDKDEQKLIERSPDRINLEAVAPQLQDKPIEMKSIGGEVYFQLNYEPISDSGDYKLTATCKPEAEWLQEHPFGDIMCELPVPNKRGEIEYVTPQQLNRESSTFGIVSKTVLANFEAETNSHTYVMHPYWTAFAQRTIENEIKNLIPDDAQMKDWTSALEKEQDWEGEPDPVDNYGGAYRPTFLDRCGLFGHNWNPAFGALDPCWKSTPWNRRSRWKRKLVWSLKVPAEEDMKGGYHGGKGVGKKGGGGGKGEAPRFGGGRKRDAILERFEKGLTEMWKKRFESGGKVEDWVQTFRKYFRTENFSNLFFGGKKEEVQALGFVEGEGGKSWGNEKEGDNKPWGSEFVGAAIAEAASMRYSLTLDDEGKYELLEPLGYGDLEDIDELEIWLLKPGSVTDDVQDRPALEKSLRIVQFGRPDTVTGYRVIWELPFLV